MKAEKQAETNGRIRERYLDLVKVMGAVCIVALHTLSNTINAAGCISEMQYTLKHVLHQFFYGAVPVFLLATGAGFLAGGRQRGYGEMKGHIIKLLTCILLFGGGFAVIKLLAAGEPIGVWKVATAVVADHTWSHMWYLYRLLGVYLCMPLLSAFRCNSNERDQWILVGILFFFFCLLPLGAGSVGVIPAQVMPLQGIWLFYVLLGGLLGSCSYEKLDKYRWILVLITVLGAGLVLCQGLRGGVLGEDNLGEMLLAVGIFLDARLLCRGKQTMRWLACLADQSLGVYLLHPVLIHVSVRILKLSPWQKLPGLTLPAMILGIYLCTAVGVMAARRIPIVRKYLL